MRHLVKEPLTAAELKKLAKMAGGAEHLVAPKRKSEAAGITGEALIAWLAEDGGRVRRPIIVVGGKVILGFAEAARNELEREESKLSLWERTADIRAEIASWPRTGLKADKAFFDSLSDEED